MAIFYIHSYRERKRSVSDFFSIFLTSNSVTKTCIPINTNEKIKIVNIENLKLIKSNLITSFIKVQSRFEPK